VTTAGRKSQAVGRERPSYALFRRGYGRAGSKREKRETKIRKGEIDVQVVIRNI
jgi:hypothetical protein